jgi:hypothetical protein
LSEVIPFPPMWAVIPTALLLLLRCDKADPYGQLEAPGVLSRLGFSLSLGGFVSPDLLQGTLPFKRILHHRTVNFVVPEGLAKTR